MGQHNIYNRCGRWVSAPSDLLIAAECQFLLSAISPGSSFYKHPALMSCECFADGGLHSLCMLTGSTIHLCIVLHHLAITVAAYLVTNSV
jgi:hypothetical protein